MKIAIQGHPIRGKEVIRIFESLGGKNVEELTGTYETFYYINDENEINDDHKNNLSLNYRLYTLEEFEKEFPFKIGDKVISLTTGLIGIVTKLKENGCYYINYNNGNIACAFGQNLKLYKEMKGERNITLTLEKAKEWYEKGGELKEVALQAYSEEELTKVELPKTWEEFCKNYPVKAGECWIGTQDTIYSATHINDRKFKNWIPSKKSAEAHLALIQLERLRDCWRQGWIPKSHQSAYVIKFSNRGLAVYHYTSREFLSFPTEEMAEKFLECFRDLIEKAGDLI